LRQKNIFLENNQFNENDLVLFKQHLSSSFPLELKNCIHQLAIEQKLENIEVCDILIKLNHHEFDDKDIPKIIRNLQSAASNNKTKNSITNISNLMKILLRIDQLEKYNKLNKQEIEIFNERINHLASMGILNQQTKIFKKLYQLNLFENEPNQQDFSQFIHKDLQRIIPKQIPLNLLGIKEILHQLYLNIDRLGIVSTLILIDNLQQLIHSGLLLTLNKTPQLKLYLIQFIEYIQTGRFIGIYLQRLIEQMNNSVQMNTIKKVLFTNKQILYLQTLTIIDTQNDNLQSLILFLHEQSSIASPPGPLPYRYIYDFIQYLRHFSQLGILYEPKLFNILTNLHKFKDQNNITIQTFKTILDQIKTIDYIYTYNHLNLIEVNHFLNDMINEGTRKKNKYYSN